MQTARKAAFLDRDGVINADLGYVRRWEDFHFAPGVFQLLQRLITDGYLLVIVTNQSGIARGMFTEADYQELTSKYLSALKNEGIEIAAVYHCPHHPQGVIAQYSRECDCRKPAPGMILRAIHELNLDPSKSLIIGDSERDLAAGRAAGLSQTILYTGKEKLIWQSI